MPRRTPSWEHVNALGTAAIERWLDSDPPARTPAGEAVASPGWRPASTRWDNNPGSEQAAVGTERERHYRWQLKKTVSVVVSVCEQRPRFYGVRPWWRALYGFRRAPKPVCP